MPYLSPSLKLFSYKMIWTNDLKFQKSSFNINFTINIKAERIKQINEIYIYMFFENQ